MATPTPKPIVPPTASAVSGTPKVSFRDRLRAGRGSGTSKQVVPGTFTADETHFVIRLPRKLGWNDLRTKEEYTDDQGKSHKEGASLVFNLMYDGPDDGLRMSFRDDDTGNNVSMPIVKALTLNVSMRCTPADVVLTPIEESTEESN